MRVKSEGGGNWNNAGNAGVFALNLNNDRSNANSNIGFRLAYKKSPILRVRLLDCAKTIKGDFYLTLRVKLYSCFKRLVT